MNVTKQVFGLLAAAGILFCSTCASHVKAEQVAAAQKPATRPNIVLILADDAGVEAFAAYGGIDVETPHIDALSRKGIKFTRMFAQPLCTPSRVELMTGKPNSENYESFGWLSPNEDTIAEKLKAKGYRTAIAGKWQLSAPEYEIEFARESAAPNVDSAIMREEYGFDEYSLWQLNNGRFFGELGSRYWAPQIEQNGQIYTYSNQEYGPSINVDFLTRFIGDSVDAGQPFFAYYSSTLPHDPWQPTPLTIGGGEFGLWESDPVYFEENVAYLDFLVGRLMKAVEDAGVADNTIFVFVSDNGTSPNVFLDTPGGEIQGGKGILSLRGTHVPLIVSGPGFESGRVDDRTMTLRDIHRLLETPNIDSLPLRTSVTPIEFTYDPKGKPFPTNKMTMVGSNRVYEAGNVTTEISQEQCCVLHEVDLATAKGE